MKPHHQAHPQLSNKPQHTHSSKEKRNWTIACQCAPNLSNNVSCWRYLWPCKERQTHMFSSINKSLFERMGPHGATSLNILELLADSTENPICRGPQNSSRTFCDEWETIKPHFQTHPHPSWAGYVWIQDCRFSGGVLACKCDCWKNRWKNVHDIP